MIPELKTKSRLAVPQPADADRIRVLFLINANKPEDAEPSAGFRSRPATDYLALADFLRQSGTVDVDMMYMDAVDGNTQTLVRMMTKAVGRTATLAYLAFLRRRQFDAIFTINEGLAIPLALLLRATRNRPGHVTIGHRLTAPKKRFFYRTVRVHREMDMILVYSKLQFDFARKDLQIPQEKLLLIEYCVDESFFRPITAADRTNQICSAGLEQRDYGTLIDALPNLPGTILKLTNFSEWSKHTDAMGNRPLSLQLDVKKYDFVGLRLLYAESLACVVPMLDADFAAGVTTILEGMAMGKPVVITRTRGNVGQLIIDDETGLSVPPHDPKAWSAAIRRLKEDPLLRQRLGSNARLWVEQNATLGHWVQHLATAIRDAADQARATRRSAYFH
jgi:glycosyltransferase involved in cell wall biosynthesis